MLGGLRRALERDFRSRVAARGAKDAAPESQRLGVGLEGERAVQCEQRAVAVAELPGRDAELVPDEREVGVGLGGAFQRGQGVRNALQLHQRRALEGEREAGRAELRERPAGELQGVVATPTAAQQLEVLGPAGLEVGVCGEDAAVGVFRVGDAALAGEPARACHRPLAGCVRKQIVGRGRSHGANLPLTVSLASRGRPV